MIELIMVIVILGILAAAAVPRFMDLSDQAQTATTQSIAGSLASASGMNAAACRVSGGGAQANMTSCTAAGSLLEGGLPTGYTLSGTAPNCTVTHSATNTTANWTLTSSAAACL